MMKAPSGAIGEGFSRGEARRKAASSAGIDDPL
jgi:hypothetical protein